MLDSSLITHFADEKLLPGGKKKLNLNAHKLSIKTIHDLLEEIKADQNVVDLTYSISELEKNGLSESDPPFSTLKFTIGDRLKKYYLQLFLDNDPALHKLSSYTDLLEKDSGFEIAELLFLAEGLAKNTHLKELDLSHQVYGRNENGSLIEKLIDGVCKNKTLHVFHFPRYFSAIQKWYCLSRFREMAGSQIKLYMEGHEITRGEMLDMNISRTLSAISKEMERLLTINDLVSYISKIPLIKSSTRDYSGEFVAQQISSRVEEGNVTSALGIRNQYKVIRAREKMIAQCNSVQELIALFEKNDFSVPSSLGTKPAAYVIGLLKRIENSELKMIASLPSTYGLREKVKTIVDQHLVLRPRRVESINKPNR